LIKQKVEEKMEFSGKIIYEGFCGALPRVAPTFFCYHQKKNNKENSPRPESSLEIYGRAD
jgi:hypothetical protein